MKLIEPQVAALCEMNQSTVFMALETPDVIFERPFFLHIYFKGHIFSGCSQDKMYHLLALILLNFNYIFYLVYLKTSLRVES